MILLLAPVQMSFAQQITRAQDPKFEGAARLAYDLSRDNFAAASMVGGLGIRLMPPPEAMQQMMQMAQLPPDQVPKDPYLLLAVYASGDPTLPADAKVSFSDMSQGRWNPNKMDKSITPAAQAMLGLKLVEWSKFFHLTYAGGPPIFYTPEMERFLTLVLITESKMITQFSANMLLTENGFVHKIESDGKDMKVTDSSIQPIDQVTMLWLISDLAEVTNDDTFFALKDPDTSKAMRELADKTFSFVKANKATTIEDKGISIVALLWYVTTTENGKLREEAISLIEEYADILGPDAKTAPELAASIRGLGEAWRITGDDRYLKTALDLWNKFDDLWDPQANFYAYSKGALEYKYNTFEVGLVFGALSEVRNIIGKETADFRITRTAEQRIIDGLLGFVLNGLKIPTKTFPPLLFAAETSYDKGAKKWTVTKPTYDTIGVQYLANELIWTEGSQINPYPSVSKALAGRTAYIASSADGRQLVVLGDQNKQVQALSDQVRALKTELDSTTKQLEKTKSEIQASNNVVGRVKGDLASAQSLGAIVGVVAVVIGTAIGFAAGRRRQTQNKKSDKK